MHVIQFFNLTILELGLRHQQARPPASAHIGCSLNLERLRTEPCSNHKATLTEQLHVGLYRAGRWYPTFIVHVMHVLKHAGST